MPNDIANFGDNNPPIDINDPDILKARIEREYAQMLARFAELMQGVERIPKTVDDEAVAKRVVDFVAQQCRTLEAEAKAAHKKEKAQFLACCKTIDAVFLRPLDALNEAIDNLGARLLVLAKILQTNNPDMPVRIHGDYGATGYVKKDIGFEVVDPTLIPLGYLRPDEKAIHDAINKYGVGDIPGIRIFEDSRFIFRKC